MVLDLANWLGFFVRAVIGLTVGLGGAEGLVIGVAVLTRADVAMGLSGLSL